MKRAVLLSDGNPKLSAVYPSEMLARIGELVSLDPNPYSREQLLADPAAFSDVEIAFSTWGMPRLSEEEIEKCLPRLSAVFYVAGSVQAFARPFLARGIRVFSAWAANAVPVAEYTVAQIILANKGYYATSRLLGERNRAATEPLKAAYPGNYGVRVGLIGCGMIASLVAEMLRSYSLEVAVYDPYLSPERAASLGVKQISLEELFATSQVVSNHLPNIESTKRMLTYPLFSSMLPYATFLNTGRGAQVIEADLVRALGEREDLTAVLDVTFPEPAPYNHPFYELPNCVLTPHIAGSSGREVVRMTEYMLEECRRYLAGEPTRYGVTEKMLETMA